MKKFPVLAGLSLVAVVPLVLSSRVEDVFFFPWRAGLLAFLGALAVWRGISWIRGASVPSVTLHELPWALLIPWALVSPAWSVNPADSMRRAVELAASIGALWVGVALAGSSRKILTAATIAVALTSVYGLLQVVNIDPMPWASAFGGRSFGTLGNPDYYAGHLLLLMPLAAAWLLSRARVAPPLVAAAALFLLGFLFSQVRGAWLAAAATLVPALWYARPMGLEGAERVRLKRGLQALGILAVVVLSTSAEMRSRAMSILQMGGYDGAGRRYLWRVAAHIWEDSPVIGFGAAGYRYHFPRFQHTGERMGSPEFRTYAYSEHAHHEILQFGAELGAVGVALFLWGLFAWWLKWQAGLRAALAGGRREESWERLGLGLGIMGCFAYSWVNFPYQIVPTAVLWWAMLGITLESSRTTARTPLPRPGAVVLGAAVVLLGLAGAMMTAADLVGDGYLKELHGRITIQDYRGASLAGPRAERMLGFDYRVYRWMSRLGMVTQNDELVEKGVQERLRLHPYMAEPLSDRMEMERKMGRTAGAEKRAKELVEFAPNFANGWGILGEIYFERGKLKEAEEAFRKAAYYQDGNPSWHHNLAATLGSLKKYKEAIEEDGKAVARDPRFVDAYLTMALSARAMGDRKLALEIAEKAYSIAPQDPRTHTLLRQVQK